MSNTQQSGHDQGSHKKEKEGAGHQQQQQQPNDQKSGQHGDTGKKQEHQQHGDSGQRKLGRHAN
ncbi:hypothetical protein [Silvibacterium bohemicum]|uniref:hypothetical protein n=2 Tax=Silvibacterium bohemicum TaxID=1577686 RepID=UPI00067867E7|nr:hypothetical protein [Silvibacterium bohemicum]